MQRTYDAIVIGGGPAGAVASVRLARLGWRIALIERAAPGRDKTCGCCLSAYAMTILDRLHLGACVRSIAVGGVDALRLHVAERPPLTMPLGSGDDAHVTVTPRGPLDESLRRAAAAEGVDICQPATAHVENIGRDAVTVTVRRDGAAHTVTARLVIGADGLASATARRTGLHADASVGRNYGCAFAWAIPDAASHRDPALPPHTVDMFLLDAGYLGIVRTGPTTMHGAAMVRGQHRRISPQDVLAEAAARYPACVEWHRAADRSPAPAPAPAARRHAAGPMPLHRKRIATGRVVLIGDAAGYVEPFTGEGMTWAIESADLLGTIAARTTPAAWNDRWAATYDAVWRHRIGAQMRRCRAVGLALRHPRICAAGLAVMARHPALARFIVNRVTAA